MQDLIRKLPGVIAPAWAIPAAMCQFATYRNHGTHAEGIEVMFDPARSATGNCWSSSSRSTTRPRSNRQGNDRGPQLSLGHLLHV
jgi:peptide-methionine (S)-S-oxide reductase